MTPDALQWHINLIQERYKSLELSPAQAGQIFLHEQEKETSSEKHFFSIWEELDYDLTVFPNWLQFVTEASWMSQVFMGMVEKTFLRMRILSYNKLFYFYLTHNFHL